VWEVEERAKEFAVVCEAEEEKSGFRGDFCDAMSRLSNSREMPDLM
jgi:hypothetical protein